MRSLLLLVLVLLGCGADDVAEGRAALTREELLNPESCKGCHPKHYEQWSASNHAYATADPVFIAMNQRGQEETGGELAEFCVNCHAPMAVRERAFTGTGAMKYASMEELPKPLQGVTCYFCHNAVGVQAEHFNGKIKLANDDVMRAAIRDPLAPSTHKVAFSSFHNAESPDSSLLCGTCHDIVTPRGFELERTLKEYSESIQAQPGARFQSCQNCHMGIYEDPTPIAVQTGRVGQATRARDFHPHLWPAVDLPLTDWPHADAMRSAVEKCELKRTISVLTVRRDPMQFGALELVLEAEAGHNFPSGATQDRRLWVEITGFDEQNKEMYNVGVIAESDPEERDGQRHPCLVRLHMRDENGQETHDFWEAESLDAAGAVEPLPFRAKLSAQPVDHARVCTLNPPLAAAVTPAARLEVRLRLRPMGMDVLKDLVASGHLAAEIPTRMQTLTVMSWMFSYNLETDAYDLISSADLDCDEWQCLMDPASKACAN